jgi:hypothetical protein
MSILLIAVSPMPTKDTMERMKYKGRVIEIFTTKIGNQWTWAFTVDGIRAGINRDADCCETLDLARTTAKAVAYALIDQEL